MRDDSDTDPMSDPREERLNEVLAGYIDEVESGVIKDRRQWLVRYPEFYDELSDFFMDRDDFEKIAAPLRDVRAPARTSWRSIGLTHPRIPNTSDGSPATK